MNEDDQFSYVKKNSFLIHVQDDILCMIYGKLGHKLPNFEKIMETYYTREKQMYDDKEVKKKGNFYNKEDNRTVLEEPHRYAIKQSILTENIDEHSISNLSSVWKIIRYILNHPSAFEEVSNSVFVNIVTSINDERRLFVRDFVNYSKFFKQHEIFPTIIATDDYSNSIDFLIFRDMNKIFLSFLENKQKYRDLMHFYIWMLNNLMFFDFDKEIFTPEDSPIDINKSIVFSTGFHKLIVKIIKKNALSLSYIDYTIS